MNDEKDSPQSLNESGTPERDEAERLKAKHARLRTFASDSWSEWINNFLNDQLCDPLLPVSRDEEKHLFLARIYNGLDENHDPVVVAKSKDCFAAAVKDVFISSLPNLNHPRKLYHLLHLISYLKPLNAKDRLRRCLRERELLGVEYGGQSLHAMLLDACAQYEVDGELVRYIYDSSLEIKEPSYALLCLHLLATREDDEYLTYLTRLLPTLSSPVKLAQLCRVLSGIFLFKGYHHFYEWYRQMARRDEAARVANFTVLEENLRDKLFRLREFPAFEKEDPLRRLMVVQLHADQRRFKPSEILALARLHERREIDADLIVDALVNLWQRTARTTKKQPWWYFVPDKFPFVNSPHRATISDGPNINNARSVHFDTREEPKLDYIFEQVKELCEPSSKAATG